MDAGRGMSRREALALGVILLVAAVVRMGWPGLTEFKADEGRLLTAALTMSDGHFAWRGISSSVGFPNAPMSVWLYSIPLFIRQHPYAATLFTGLLSVVAVGLTYWLARRYWGARAAVAAALLLAASPWAILFSRKIWAQNLLPAFVVGWAIGAALAYVDGRRPYLILHFVCLAVAAQIHPAALGLVPATLIYLIVFRRRVDWRYLIVGGLLAALTAAPFLWYLWGRWRAEGGLPFSTGQSSAQLSPDSLRATLEIVSGQGYRGLAGDAFAGLPGEWLVQAAALAVALAGVGVAGWLVARRWDEPASRVAFIGLVWLLSPVIFFAWHRTPVYIHYFIASLPAACLLAGMAFDRGSEALRPAARRVAWGALLLLAVAQLAGWGGMMTAIAANPLAGGFGAPLAVKLPAADRARALARETGAAEILVAGDGANPEQEDFPAEFRALLHGEPLRYVNLNREAVFPAAPAVVLLGLDADDGPSSTRPLYLAAGGEPETFPVPGTALAYATLALPPAAQPAPGVSLEPEPLLANFARFYGFNPLRPIDGGVVWDVFWRPADQPDAADYHLFNHLLDGGGNRVAQADGAAFGSEQWRAGDVVISRFLLPVDGLPDGPLTMRVGMYRFPSLAAVPVLDEAANPAGDAVELPLSD